MLRAIAAHHVPTGQRSLKVGGQNLQVVVLGSRFAVANPLADDVAAEALLVQHEFITFRATLKLAS